MTYWLLIPGGATTEPALPANFFIVSSILCILCMFIALFEVSYLILLGFGSRFYINVVEPYLESRLAYAMVFLFRKNHHFATFAFIRAARSVNVSPFDGLFGKKCIFSGTPLGEDGVRTGDYRLRMATCVELINTFDTVASIFFIMLVIQSSKYSALVSVILVTIYYFVKHVLIFIIVLLAV